MSKNTLRNARLRVIQEQYSSLLSGGDDLVIIDWDEFAALDFAREYDKELYNKIKHSIQEHLQQIDALIDKYSVERNFDSLNPIDVAILRVAIAEAFYLREVSYKVVFNEAIEIAKAYGTANSYKYINGVLGSILRNEFPNLGKEASDQQKTG